MNYFKPIAYIGRILGLMPLVCFFKAKDLEENLINAGFTIEHIWQPGKNKAVFIVAKSRFSTTRRGKTGLDDTQKIAHM